MGLGSSHAIRFVGVCWFWRDDPEKLFGSQGFRLSVDPESQMAVFFPNTEPKDLFQVQEAADNVFPLFVVNRFDVAPVSLRLFDGWVRIVKQGFSCRGPGQDLSPTVGKEREGLP
jgi:hypothetical protein